MGSTIERTLRKDGVAYGVSYQAMVKVPGAKAAVRTYRNRDEAQAFIEDFENGRKVTAHLAKRAKARIQVEGLSHEEAAKAKQELWRDQWLKETLEKFKQANIDDRPLRTSPRTIIKIGGDAKLGELDQKWVRDYIAAAKKCNSQFDRPFALSSIVDQLVSISTAMKWQAVELGAAGEKLPYSLDMFPSNWNEGRERRLAPGEERMIVRALVLGTRDSSRHYLRLFRLALSTAARMQELVLANWSEFNMDKRFWTIPAKHSKTKKKRVVPLSRQAIRCLKAMRLIMNKNSPRVFHAISDPHTASVKFYKLIRRLGIVGLRFHDFRHESISRMVLKQRRLSVYEIMDIVGHSSIKMLMRYTNLRGDELVEKWDD